MVRGLDSFREWFNGYEANYVVIGGTACELLLSEAELGFRLTQDIDIVLIVETLDSVFSSRFWEYVKMAGYEHYRKSTDTPIYYRFNKPKSHEYPAMIELFSRRIEGIQQPSGVVITPVPIDENISSLSAILLDDEYYNFLKSGITVVRNIPILSATHLIPFKARAWLDLTARKTAGEPVKSRDIKKHKSDIITLSGILPIGQHITLPAKIKDDMFAFISANTDGNTDTLRIIAKFYEVHVN